MEDLNRERLTIRAMFMKLHNTREVRTLEIHRPLLWLVKRSRCVQLCVCLCPCRMWLVRCQRCRTLWIRWSLSWSQQNWPIGGGDNRWLASVGWAMSAWTSCKTGNKCKPQINEYFLYKHMAQLFCCSKMWNKKNSYKKKVEKQESHQQWSSCKYVAFKPEWSQCHNDHLS